MICEYVGLKLSGCWYLYPFAKSVKKKKKKGEEAGVWASQFVGIRLEKENPARSSGKVIRWQPLFKKL